MSETMKSPVSKLADEYGSSRRRTQRVKIAIPVTVRIPRANASFYEETTETVVVNAHGCLARLAVPLEQGQQIRIINTKSSEEQECVVVWIGQFSEGKTEVGLEFSEPAPQILANHLPTGGLEPSRQKAPNCSPNAAAFDIEVNDVRPDLCSNLTAKRHAPALCDSICCMVPRNQFRIASSISSCVPQL